MKFSEIRARAEAAQDWPDQHAAVFLVLVEIAEAAIDIGNFKNTEGVDRLQTALAKLEAL